MKEFLYLQNKQQQQLQKLAPANSFAASPVPRTAYNNDTANCGVMPCWYFDKNELRDAPSIKSGISFETERRYRREGARFITDCGTRMGLSHSTMATGIVYFHRFYMFHSFKSFPRYVTACCCLFLAGKVEETPKKCRDIIKVARGLLPDNHFYSFGEDPKEEVMTLERILLQTIKFDLQVEHPFTFLVKYAKCFKGDQPKLQKMVQMAWNFVNDSLSTVVCLQWEPEIIAVALIHLASKLSKFTVVDWVGRQPHHTRWWDMFVSDVTMEILEDICHQVLDLYQSNQKDPIEPTESPPQKPPSRADSPTPLKALPGTSVGGVGGGSSPSSALKSKPTATAAYAGSSTSNLTAAILGTSSTSATTEINNIQKIKSLANSTPDLPPGVDPMSVAALTSGYHMYAPPPPVVPHQMHAIYSAAPGPPPPPPHGYGVPVGVASATNPAIGLPLPLAPPPPMAPYGAGQPPPPNAWPNAMGSRVPPPPPPGGSGDGYYQQGPAYGRQQQQRY